MNRVEELVKNVDGKTALVIAGAGYLGYKFLLSSERKINAPTIGPTGVWGAYSNLWNGRFRLQEGYDKFNPTSGSFKIAMVDRWNIIVTGKNVEELRHAPEDVLSFHDAAGDGIAIDYTMGPAMRGNMFHVSIIKNQLTRNLPILLPDVMDEIMIGFEQEINSKLLPGDEWTKIKARNIIPQIVSRASNRILVGLPTCRIQAYLDLNVEFATSVIGTATFINLFPKIIRPLVGWSVSRTHKVINKMLDYLGPIIEERKKLLAEDRPNDFLTWVMNELEVREQDPNLTEKTKRETNTPYFMALMILSTNFAAIHTSSMSFTQALYWLASNPDAYMKQLREEIEEVVEKHGWTKQSLVKMRKLDSFMRESQRISGLGGTVMGRKAVKDYTFSDGTFVPAGHVVSTPLTAAHHDPARYDNPSKFNGFRFANMREGDGDGSKWQMVATSPDYLPFGHGHHACPGRFFAANELKLMMAQLVLHYDIKMEKDGERPSDEWFGAACIPNREGEVMFRRRKF